MTSPHAELKRLAEAATAGPWTSHPVERGSECFGVYAEDNIAHCWFLDEETHGLHPLDNAAVNASFIAAANPSTILSLIEENERMREALTQVRNTTDQRTGYSDLSARRAAFKASNEALGGQP